MRSHNLVSRRLYNPLPNQLDAFRLEPRALLAGDVGVSLSNGTLFITGDAADNSVLISTFNDPQDGPGFLIQGQFNNGATTVNGSLLPVEVFGVLHLDVFMGLGDDGLTITNDVAAMLASFEGNEPIIPVDAVVLSGQAKILMGDGDNQVDIGWLTTGSRLIVEGGAQNDVFRFSGLDVGTNFTVRTFGDLDNVFVLDSRVNDNTNIRTANGDAWVAIDGFSSNGLYILNGNHNDDVSLNGLTIDDDLVVEGNLGNDGTEIGVPGSFPWEVLASDLTFVGDRLVVRGGDGDNLADLRDVDAGMISIVNGDHFDEVYLQSVFAARNVYISTGMGGSYVDFDNVEITNYLTLIAGSGNDEVSITNTTTGTFATISMLSGDDIVGIDNMDVTTNLNVFLGNGDDDLILTSSSASNANLYGNAGFDQYIHAGNSFGTEDVFSFEEE